MAREAYKNASFVIVTNYLTKFSRDIILPSLPALAIFYQVDETYLKYAVPIYFLGIMFSRLIWPPLADMYSRKHVMMLAGSMFCVSSIMTLMAPTANAFLFARFFQALGIAGVPLIARSYIYKSQGENHVLKLYAFLGVFIAWSPGIALALGGYLEHSFGTKSSLYTLLFFGLGFLIFARFLLPSAKPVIKPIHSKLSNTFQTVIRNKHFWQRSLPFNLLMAGTAAYFTASPFLFINHLGVSAWHYGLLSFGVLTGLVIGKLLAGLLVDHYDFHKLLLYGICISIAAACALLLFNSILMIALLCGLYFVGVGLLNPTTKTAVMSLNHDQPASALAIQGFVEAGFSMTAALIAAYFTSQTALPLAGILLALSTTALLIHLHTRTD